MATNDLDRTFQQLKRRKKKALIAYLAAGYPRFAEQEKLIRALEEGGVDILELGIPFSDPIADGPTIQFASQESLKNGTSLTKILRWVGHLRPSTRMPIVAMSYINPILAFGVEAFAEEAGRAGLSGVIIPDLIPEEAGELKRVLAKQGIHLVFLVAPTTPPARLRLIARRTGGFLYAVSVTGVTGARSKFSGETGRWLSQLKKKTTRPVCVGFGISGPKQIQLLKRSADGFIVGSALIDLIRRTKGPNRVSAVRRFIKSLAKECADAH